jgi:DNA primase
MEGYTDVIQAHKNGFENSIASLGTAFTEEQATLIKRYTENAYIAYDADTAGNKATLKGLEILNEIGINVKVIELEEGSDPDQLLKNEGSDVFSQFINKKKKNLTYTRNCHIIKKLKKKYLLIL